MKSFARKFVDWISCFILRLNGTRFGKAVEIINVRFLSLGNNAFIGNFVRIQASGSIKIKDNVYIGHNNYIFGKNIYIGNDFMSGPNVCIMAGNHGLKLNAPINAQPTTNLGIRIGNDVWVGCNATILDGVVIGDHVVIGAGSVVTKSLPNFSICVGNPAHPISYRNK
jgi:acetyltransferase-like isoleucine patch superfamily enzyme